MTNNYITKLKIKNMIGLKEFTLNGESVELVGNNGTGKTSVLDAIRYALTNSSNRKYIIKNGAEEGEVYIETSDGLTINRKKRESRSDYKKITKNGENIDKPESFLQEIFTELQLNPIGFINLDDKEQNRILLNLIKFDWDLQWIEKQFGEIPSGVNYDQNILNVLNEIQSEKGVYYTTRHQLNLSAREKTAIREEILKDIPLQYNYAFWKNYDIDKIYERLNKARLDNAKIIKCQEFQKNFDDKKSLADEQLKTSILELEKEVQTEKDKINEQIRQLQLQLKDLDTSLDASTKILKNEHEKKLMELQQHNIIALEHAGKEIIDTESMENEVATAKKMLSYINEYERVLKVDADIKEDSRKASELTEKIELARNLPSHVLANAEIPIEGLTVKDGLVLINGKPVSDLSEGEKLKLCIDIAMNRENNLNLLLIDGVEKLGEDNRKILYEKLKREGINFIATRTTDDDELDIIKL